jgi:hypothetical protein
MLALYVLAGGQQRKCSAGISRISADSGQRSRQCKQAQRSCYHGASGFGNYGRYSTILLLIAAGSNGVSESASQTAWRLIQPP